MSGIDPDELARIVREVVGEVMKEDAPPAARSSTSASSRSADPAPSRPVRTAPSLSASAEPPTTAHPSGSAATPATDARRAARVRRDEPPAPHGRAARAARALADEPYDPTRRVDPGRAETATPGRRGPTHQPLPAFRRTDVVDRLVDTTPSRILQGRTGTRYLTETYLGLRADHAIALDAVESQVPEGWAEQQGWIALRSQAADHQDFLLYPDKGRRLDEASRAKAASEADREVDVQLIAGDGLSAHALMVNGPALITALHAAHGAAGFRVGRPIFVKYARIGIADDIGVITRARSTIIIVGERPGLGTGDSLSIYTAVGPKLGQDNAEKDCISNVRRAGLAPEVAAARCAELMRRSFAAGGGGVKLAQGGAA